MNADDHRTDGTPESIGEGVPIYGVDFSGAADAGANLWLAAGRATEPALRVEVCAPAVEVLADWYDGPPTTDRDATLAALRAFVRSLDAGSVVALDVSFGVPAPVAGGALDADCWVDALDAVAAFDSATAFSDRCVGWARGTGEVDGTYVRRVTDELNGAFSPYHFFVKHQTYHAARTVLRPLVAGGDVHVLPMAAGEAGGARPILLESYPAATLEDLGLHRERYKGGGAGERTRRERNLDGLCDRGLGLSDGFPRERVLADEGGDGLDAVVAAFAAYRNRDDLTPETDWRPVEGHIYV